MQIRKKLHDRLAGLPVLTRARIAARFVKFIGKLFSLRNLFLIEDPWEVARLFGIRNWFPVKRPSRKTSEVNIESHCGDQTGVIVGKVKNPGRFPRTMITRNGKSEYSYPQGSTVKYESAGMGNNLRRSPSEVLAEDSSTKEEKIARVEALRDQEARDAKDIEKAREVLLKNYPGDPTKSDTELLTEVLGMPEKEVVVEQMLGRLPKHYQPLDPTEEAIAEVNARIEAAKKSVSAEVLADLSNREAL